MMKNAYEKAKIKYLPRNDVTSIAIGKKFKKGQWTDEMCISIGVKEKKPLSELSKKEVLPKTISGVKTDVLEMNLKPMVVTDRLYTLQGGISIGREASSYSGTLGCIVFKDGEPYALTNYHVIVPPKYSTDKDYILQPSNTDGGKNVSDRIGTIADSYLDTEGDLGLVKIDTGLRQYSQLIFTSEAEILSIADASVDNLVSKSGRTTGVTNGKVTAIGTYAVDFSAWGKGTIYIEGFQIAPISDPYEAILAHGDSGSCVYLTNTDYTAVGVLCAGTESPNPILGVACHITTAFDILGISTKIEKTFVHNQGSIIGILNIPWVSAEDDLTQTLSLIFDSDYDAVHLYVDEEYDDILWAKLNGETNYKPIKPYSQIPTCVLGDVTRNREVSVDFKIRPLGYSSWDTEEILIAGDRRSNDGYIYTCILGHESDSTTEPGTGVYWETYWTLTGADNTDITAVVGHQVIPVYVTYGNTTICGLNIADITWINDESVIKSWASSAEEMTTLAWRELS